MEKVTIKTRTASGKWIFAIVVTLLFQLNVLADTIDPPTDFGGGDNPTDETPAMPIDDYIFVSLALGIGYAFYKYKAIGKQNKADRIL